MQLGQRVADFFPPNPMHFGDQFSEKVAYMNFSSNKMNFAWLLWAQSGWILLERFLDDIGRLLCHFSQLKFAMNFENIAVGALWLHLDHCYLLQMNILSWVMDKEFLKWLFELRSCHVSQLWRAKFLNCIV